MIDPGLVVGAGNAVQALRRKEHPHAVILQIMIELRGVVEVLRLLIRARLGGLVAEEHVVRLAAFRQAADVGLNVINIGCLPLVLGPDGRRRVFAGCDEICLHLQGLPLHAMHRGQTPAAGGILHIFHAVVAHQAAPEGFMLVRVDQQHLLIAGFCGGEVAGQALTGGALQGGQRVAGGAGAGVQRSAGGAGKGGGVLRNGQQIPAAAAGQGFGAHGDVLLCDDELCCAHYSTGSGRNQ